MARRGLYNSRTRKIKNSGFVVHENVERKKRSPTGRPLAQTARATAGAWVAKVTLHNLPVLVGLSTRRRPDDVYYRWVELFLTINILSIV